MSKNLFWAKFEPILTTISHGFKIDKSLLLRINKNLKQIRWVNVLAWHLHPNTLENPPKSPPCPREHCVHSPAGDFGGLPVACGMAGSGEDEGGYLWDRRSREGWVKAQTDVMSPDTRHSPTSTCSSTPMLYVSTYQYQLSMYQRQYSMSWRINVSINQ